MGTNDRGLLRRNARRDLSSDRHHKSIFGGVCVGDGLENCTLYLLLKGWSGAWIDGSAACYEDIMKNLVALLARKTLRARHSFITAENIEQLFSELGVPQEFDLLSIDINRNDY